ncbi:MAG: 6-phosphofructokinase [Oscillospiraceae bacterium]
MKLLKGACVIGQSGGPTAVINSSVCGAVMTALKNPNITEVYGAQNGIEGVLKERLFNCGKESEKELLLLKNTPAAAFGSCRYKLKGFEEDETDYKRILEVFKKYDVRYFFYNGGNDSMDTCHKVAQYFKKVGYECNVIGIPKTIDNDLACTDHCPGYGSAAKYIATSVSEISLDAGVYDKGSVIVFEIMGRNAGWLTAAAALANEIGEGPDLVYLPEVPFDIDRFVRDVENVYYAKGRCIVAVSEGVHDIGGKYISEYGSDLAKSKDMFGHSQMGGLASTLAGLIKEKTGAKTRGIEFSLLQRCAAHCASKTDIDEAYAAGKAAVESAVGGMTDCMVAFVRAEGEYKCSTQLFDLGEIANVEKTVPASMMNADGNNVNCEFIKYALPLINGEPERVTEKGLPRYAKLNKIFVD